MLQNTASVPLDLLTVHFFTSVSSPIPGSSALRNVSLKLSPELKITLRQSQHFVRGDNFFMETKCLPLHVHCFLADYDAPSQPSGVAVQRYLTWTCLVMKKEVCASRNVAHEMTRIRKKALFRNFHFRGCCTSGRLQRSRLHN